MAMITTTIAQLLRQHARERGEQVAFSGPSGRAVTYASLDQRTERLAGHLAGAGVRRGHRVALVLPSCIEAVESTYAITRAAAVGVPLDPRSSQVELTRALRNSGARVVVTDGWRWGRVRDAVEALQYDTEGDDDARDVLVVMVASELALDLGAEAADTEQRRQRQRQRQQRDRLTVLRYEDWASHPPPQQTPDDLGLDEPAWLHYTTGTTGQPKGVLSSQRSYMWTATVSYGGLLGMTSADVLFWPLPLFHSFGHSLPLIGTLVTGATTHLLGGEPLLDGLLSCSSRGPTILAGTPTTYRELVVGLEATASSSSSSSSSSSPPPSNLLPLLLRPRACISAGAPAPAQLSGQVEAALGVPLLNHYGSSESCGPVASHYPGDASYEDSCGLPLPGVQVKLVDPCPPDQNKTQTQTNGAPDAHEGEIWIRTPSLMLGYDEDGVPRRPPHAVTDGGWYRTGDVGRLVGPDGFLAVTGRLKELIIRGGENIHPGEVERAVLARCAGMVDDVVVVGVPHDMFGQVPAAFVVPKHKEGGGGGRGGDALDGKKGGAVLGVDLTAMLAACRTVLPEYKVPVAFYAVDAVPRTPSGKPKRLAALDLLRQGLCRPITADVHSTDKIEALVLAEAVSVCCGGAQAQDLAAEGEEEEERDQMMGDSSRSFKALGLNSLAGVVLRDRLVALTGLDLPVTLVFDYPTPAKLAQYLCQRLLPPLGASSTYPPDDSEDQDTQQRPGSTTPRPTPRPSLRPADHHHHHHPEPIAIISTACRYPGGISSPSDLWRVVADGVDTSSPFPADRGWDLDGLYDPDPDRHGTCTTRRGGFLHDMALFDAGLFGVSPREALTTDPQHRLLLETAWDLVERARIAPSSLAGSPTAVYAGLIYGEYASRFPAGAEGAHEAHLRLGSDPGVAAGRIAYALDLRGPALAVNAGCSSSLVAMHLAASALRARECSLAVAGGATVMATPHQLLMFSRQRGLSPDGRCRSYAAGADGTAWSEGVGLVMLERLSDARRNGHRVLGVIRGSAVNSDGTSNGLTAPSGPAQQRVIRQALAQAGLGPEDVDVLEGHGTATPLGDPVEVQAVMSTYGDRPKSRPLLLGSVKSNIGHTQGAAGVAGVIKMIEAMRHGVAPASLHISKPSPYVDWSSGAVELLTESRPWPQTRMNRPRRAAVSSFGIGGTNCHIILEQDTANDANLSPDETMGESVTRRTLNTAPYRYPWLLSGADEAALRAQAKSIANLIHDHHDPTDVAFSLATTRSSLAHRASVAASSKEDLEGALRALAEGRVHPSVFTDVATGSGRTRARLVFLFSGQGSQRRGMAKELCALFPRFHSVVREVRAELDRWLERPLEEVVIHDDLGQSIESSSSSSSNNNNSSSKGSAPQLGLLDRPDYAQAAIFAFEVALYRLLESFGLRASYVAGHSVGEVAAAHVAGILSLKDAAMLVATRGTMMAALPHGGAMASIAATAEEVAREVGGLRTGTVAIAAVNAENSVVISGAQEAVTAVMDIFANQGRCVTKLRVTHAFHSPLMAPMVDGFRQTITARGLSVGAGKPEIPLLSTVTGKLVEDARELSPEYWARHVVSPVRFADAIRSLQTICPTATYVEVGPSAPLTRHVPAAVAMSGKSEVNALLKGLGQLWARGIAPSTATEPKEAAAASSGWDAVFAGSGARVVDLPVYPFQRRRYWLDAPALGPKRRDDKGSAGSMRPLSLEMAPAFSAGVADKTCIRSDGLPTPITPDLPSPFEHAMPEQVDTSSPQTSPPKDHRDMYTSVQEEIAAVLGYQDQRDVPWGRPLAEMGFDSFTALLLRKRLTSLTGRRVPANLIFDEGEGTVTKLVEYLLMKEPA